VNKGPGRASFLVTVAGTVYYKPTTIRKAVVQKPLGKYFLLDVLTRNRPLDSLSVAVIGLVGTGLGNAESVGGIDAGSLLHCKRRRRSLIAAQGWSAATTLG